MVQIGRVVVCRNTPHQRGHETAMHGILSLLSGNCHILATFFGMRLRFARRQSMDEWEYNTKLDELDHLLNDDLDTPSEPSRIWDLLAEVSHHDLRIGMMSGAEQAVLHYLS